MSCRNVSFLLVVACLLAPISRAAADEKSDLQARFKQRSETLLELRKTGKVGELLYNGMAAAVKPEYLDEKVTEKGRADQRTLKAFLEEENADRLKLYQILAKENNTPVETIAKNNAIRIFKKAGPEEYFKVSRDGAWAQKKDIKFNEGGA